uniref:Uncharacterized protein n=1 Tax=Leersia perrieri TaxID=77586 RepID=A0A0D9XPN0_9ORYZ
MLKSYSILISDDGRRFTSLLVLPMGPRKEWLLIKIKNSEACSICSACTDKYNSETLTLRYVSLPVEAPAGEFDEEYEYDGYEESE